MRKVTLRNGDETVILEEFMNSRGKINLRKTVDNGLYIITMETISPLLWELDVLDGYYSIVSDINI